MEKIELTDEQLEQELIARKKAKAAKIEKERKAYEASRDSTVSSLVARAEQLVSMLTAFKNDCHQEMQTHAEKLAGYGKLRSNSKGGFQLLHSNDAMKVVRRRDTEPTWDERADKGSELIKDFLGDTIKKRDKDMYEILMSFLEKNNKGDLEYSKVFDLLKHESKFTDTRWTEGLRMIKESFGNHLKGFGYEFKVKGADGKWINLIVNFSSL